MDFLKVLGRTLSLLDLPFGYTLTVWTSGAIALRRFGVPSLLDSLLFALGAIIAYLICAALAYRQLDGNVSIHVEGVAFINVISIVAAGAVSVVADLISNPTLGYPVAGFAGTLAYILCMSALLYVAHLLRRAT